MNYEEGAVLATKDDYAAAPAGTVVARGRAFRYSKTVGGSWVRLDTGLPVSLAGISTIARTVVLAAATS